MEYCLGDDQTPCTSGIEVLPGDAQQITAAEMETGSILKVTNKSEVDEGSYEVEVL
ncbi:MAG: hypothetical protein H8E57_06755 [Candidatus Cloacimonetes bacterium]|nr:hypothetical protein [Candidatus Cloacimonadota bacterium]